MRSGTPLERDKRVGISYAAAAVIIAIVISASAVTIVGIQTSNLGTRTTTQTVATTTTATQVSTTTQLSTTTQTLTSILTEIVTTTLPPTTGVQISVTSASLAAASFPGGGPSGTIFCVTTGPTAPFLTLVNSGTAPGTITGVTITWAGSTASFSAPASCTIGAVGSASSTLYIEFTTPKLATAAQSGQSFTGAVTLSNGANLLFTNTWL